jgi:uncharacterized membrane protein
MQTPHRSETVLVHFYRAVVGHMDVWRQRMDATTNWAAATAAGMITFAFGSIAAPHYVLLLAMAFQVVFLLMESRRYQTFDLWRRRFRALNRAFILPTLEGVEPDEASQQELSELARDMGRTLPHMSLADAAGYRIRRNYGYLLGVTVLAWLMKVEVQPTPAYTIGAFFERASLAFIPGPLVVAIVLGFVLALFVLALTSPTHDMVDWEATQPLWERLRERGGRILNARGDVDVD